MRRPYLIQRGQEQSWPFVFLTLINSHAVELHRVANGLQLHDRHGEMDYASA